MARLPLDTAADAGSLIAIDRLAGEYCLDGSAKIMAGNRLVVARSAIVELSMVGQTALLIKKIKFWSTGRVIGFRDLLRLIVAEWKGELKTYGHFFQFRRGIIRIAGRIITADRENPQVCIFIVASESGQLLLDMHYIGAVTADEHDEQPCLRNERVERVRLPRHDVL